jgi:hypothetical protein
VCLLPEVMWFLSVADSAVKLKSVTLKLCCIVSSTDAGSLCSPLTLAQYSHAQRLLRSAFSAAVCVGVIAAVG